MFRKDKSVRDGFAFSLGGTTVITAVVAAPAIDSNQLNQRRRGYLNRSQDESSEFGACHDERRVPA